MNQQLSLLKTERRKDFSPAPDSPAPHSPRPPNESNNPDAAIQTETVKGAPRHTGEFWTAEQEQDNRVHLDQFYTRPELAERYAEQMRERWPDPDVLFVEPSAGTGAFALPLLDASRKVLAIDIEPKSPSIQRMDFLHSEGIFKGDHSAIVVIGNPPFGKNACTAVQFFNRAADHADEIAFIVPRTFRKMSLQKRLHRMFHLSEDEDVGDQAFIRFGKPHDVPCAWQIWTKHDAVRPLLAPPPVNHLISYTTPQKASFAMRRVGFYAGRITTENIISLSQTTHYFMQEMADGVIDALRSVNWSDIAGQTAGVRSLSKAEIAFKLDEIYRA